MISPDPSLNFSKDLRVLGNELIENFMWLINL